MQVNEKEIILPFRTRRELYPSKRSAFLFCLVNIFLLGAGIFRLIPLGVWPLTLAELFPSILLFLLALFLLPLSVFVLTSALRKDKPRLSNSVRISHEGIAFSHLFPALAWEEISALVPYTWTQFGQSRTSLGIVPRNPSLLLARMREKNATSFLSRMSTRFVLYTYRNALTILNIPKSFLPIPMDEFLALIEERFADELSRYDITIAEWQDVTTR